MGNKTGKFNVPSTEKINKDDEVINETEVKVESSNMVEANGDHSKQEGNGIEKPETAPAAKKKNIVSWFKKVSMRKEKKPKALKENGVKEEVAEENANGEVQSEKLETKEEIAVNHEEAVEPSPELGTEEKKDEAPINNDHEHCTETPATETPNEEEQ